MTATQLQPDRGDLLLQLAGEYIRGALDFPQEVATLRTLVAELMLEVGFARHDVRRLTSRVEALEKRLGVGS